MPKKKLISGIWLITMSLLALTAYTMYFVAQMRFSLLLYSYSALVAAQVFSLTVFLIGPEKIKLRPVHWIYNLCRLTSLAVIPALCFICFGLISQYHVTIKDAVYVAAEDYATIAPADETIVYQTDQVYIFYPEYTSVTLACGERPDKSDKTITWCSGAAFQHTIEFGFTHENIVGHYASDGIFYEAEYLEDNMAAVCFYNGTYKFDFDDPKKALQETAANGGSGFMQYAIIRDGEVVNELALPRVRSYRVMAELNGQICIIDTIKMTHFDEMIQELTNLGVTNAVYMDMGAGWNYSWYRTAEEKVRTLFGLKVPWSHNWIVFRQ